MSRFIRDIELDLRLDGDRVEVQQIASMLKHSTDGFPK